MHSSYSSHRAVREHLITPYAEVFIQCFCTQSCLDSCGISLISRDIINFNVPFADSSVFSNHMNNEVRLSLTNHCFFALHLYTASSCSKPALIHPQTKDHLSELMVLKSRETRERNALRMRTREVNTGTLQQVKQRTFCHIKQDFPIIWG